MRNVLVLALTTGAFCAGFATLIDLASVMLVTYQVALVAAVSGFLGSIFASLVWTKKN